MAGRELGLYDNFFTIKVGPPLSFYHESTGTFRRDEGQQIRKIFREGWIY